VSPGADIGDSFKDSTMTKTIRLLGALAIAAVLAAFATTPPPPAPAIPQKKLDAKSDLESGR
jgi:hypothetical protein